MQTRNLAARAGHWSARHRKRAIFGWIAFVVVAFMIGSATGLNTLEQEDLGNGESQTALRAIEKAGLKERASEEVLIQARGASPRAEDREFRAAVADVERAISQNPAVTDLSTPYAKGNSGQISGDSRSALVTFQIKGDEDQAEDRVAPILKTVAATQRAHPELRIEEFGDASSTKALSKAFEDDFKKAETLSLPITLLILLVAFGALVAAGLPVMLGLTAVIATLGLIGPISQIWPVDEAISSVILLIGLAVGVDYSLFYIRREREERAAGRSQEAALEVAAATSGRAVLVSGGTVMAAMAGMYLTGNATFTSFGTGTILVVAIAMLGSVTVLPALLSKLGDRIDKGRVPFLSRRKRGDGGAWAWIVDRVLRHPVVSVVLAGGVLVVMCIPTFSLHTVNTGVNGLPPDLAVTKTLKRIQAAFPGGAAPAQVVIEAKDVSAPRVQQAIGQIELGALGTGLMREPVITHVNADRTVAVVDVPVAGSGTDSTSDRAVHALRDVVVPQTIGRVPGVQANVGGLTAESIDFNDQMTSRAPWVFAFVLGLAFLLLLVTFRSIVIPLKAITLNLLSVGAAYGVLVWVFQYGHLEGALGFKSIGGITSWLPLFLFVVLFGLSMDYHVLILSRVREAFDRGESSDQAVATGIRATAGVVTSAAVVMVAVFAIFATLSTLDFKMMGVGLATAILIDATIVRVFLLPASMKLLGDRNWYLPSWLEWLPHVEHDAFAPGAALAAKEQAAAGGPGVLTMEEIDDGGRLRLRLDGELDLVTAPWLARRLQTVEAEKPPVLVIDLRDLTFMDSSGLRELFSAQRRARAEGRRVALVKGSEPIDRVLEMVSADRAMETVDDPADVK
ncbi:MAG TPA: MMPL family transporter [Thermoleophilaceae bacterium]|nr:MMPL family transporter [Thermoleophilaceae bacterium]